MAARQKRKGPPSQAKPLPPRAGSPETPSATARMPAVLTWAERAAVAALIATAVALSFRFWLSAGGLWRDEVNSVNLVSWPIGEVWRKLQYDSFPILWFLVLKSWIAVFGGSDFAIRGLGFATGLGIVAAIWWTGRALGARAPLLSLSLFGLVPALVVYGSSIRAFGMGVMLITMTLGAMWRMIEKPAPWRIAAALLAALLAVQCLYHNCVLLFAIGVGAAAAGCLRSGSAARRRWIIAGLPLAIGAVAAATMLPYRETVAQIGAWNIIIKQPVDVPFLLTKFASTVDPSLASTDKRPGSVMIWVWLALAAVGVAACVWGLASRRERLYLPAKAAAAFVLVSAPVALTAYVAFLKSLSYPTQVWYYLPLAAVLALSLEAALFPLLDASLWGRGLRIAAAFSIAAVLTLRPALWDARCPGTWAMSAERETNVDLIAAQLGKIAAKDDYIVLNPFFLGVSFDRYYRGAAAWTTVPDVGEHRIHRYDLFMAKMAEPRPVTPVLLKIQETLRSGHRVWLVLWGGFSLLSPGQRPVVLPPAPGSPYGWSEGAYEASWSQQVAAAIQPAISVREVPVTDRPVVWFEHADLVEVSGWRL